jgi:hypothetical protein
VLQRVAAAAGCSDLQCNFRLKLRTHDNMPLVQIDQASLARHNDIVSSAVGHSPGSPSQAIRQGHQSAKFDDLGWDFGDILLGSSIPLLADNETLGVYFEVFLSVFSPLFGCTD